LEKCTGNVIELVSNTVKHEIMRMKTGRTAGPGDIPIDLIKRGGQSLLEMITILLNKIINAEEGPESWKSAIITSIHKKGNKRKCENYRGISVTSTFSRICGRILAKLVESECKNMEWKNNQNFALEVQV